MEIKLKSEKQKEFENLLVENTNKAETLEEWKEKVEFASGFSY